jgi:hypothetical protein
MFLFVLTPFFQKNIECSLSGFELKEILKILSESLFPSFCIVNSDDTSALAPLMRKRTATALVVNWKFVPNIVMPLIF